MLFSAKNVGNHLLHVLCKNLTHFLIVTCEFCDKTFSRKDSLQKHKKKYHGATEKKRVSITTCDIYQKLFSQTGNFKCHKTKVHRQAK